MSTAAVEGLLQISFPRGRTVRLATGTDGIVRGEGFVRIDEAPPGAPTLLLLHGWTATADINWASSYAELSPHYGLVAPDLHGHGRGPRRRRRFRLEECANDVATLAEQLGVKKAIVVGYSMGGTIAQLLWRHHPDLVEGMVLCATAGTFSESRREQVRFSGLALLALLAAVLPRWVVRWGGSRFVNEKTKQGISEWVLGEMHRHEPLRLLQAGRELGLFDSRAWLKAVDVPVTSVITTLDDVVSPRRQRELAKLIGTTDIFKIDGRHTVCLRSPQQWARTLRCAVDVTAAKVATDSAPTLGAVSKKW